MSEVLAKAVNVAGIRPLKLLLDVLNIPDLKGAACKGSDDPDMFFVRPAKARKVCGVCPVREKCLESALDWDRKHPDRFGLTQGIVGGTSELERRKLLDERYKRC